MKTFLIVSIFLISLGATASWAGDIQRLEKGETIVRTVEVEGSPVAAAKMMAILNVSPDKLWPLIDKCEDYETNMPRIKHAKELTRKNNIITCSVTVEMPFPLKNLTATTRAKHTVKPGELYKRAWTLVEGDYEKNTGSWTLTPHGEGKTLVVYAIHAVPNIPVPAFLQKSAQKSSLPNLIETLRKKSGG